MIIWQDGVPTSLQLVAWFLYQSGETSEQMVLVSSLYMENLPWDQREWRFQLEHRTLRPAAIHKNVSSWCSAGQTGRGR
ncbi:hypothetical protein Mapa_005907 [Marchantia paleacea]|nr:hypothetical protein Mapa_005907 [Marchantia paleacea]